MAFITGLMYTGILITLCCCSVVLVHGSTSTAPMNFTECCLTESVSQACTDTICYIDPAVTVSAVQITTDCASDLTNLLKCGLTGIDTTSCCTSESVSGICLDLCDGNTNPTLTASHLACLANMVEILTCQQQAGTASNDDDSSTTGVTASILLMVLAICVSYLFRGLDL